MICPSAADSSTPGVGKELADSLRTVSSRCTDCGLCKEECAFLGKYGTPKEIADGYDPADKKYQGLPFECSLCSLCDAICPEKVDPSRMFLDMRRRKTRDGSPGFPEHGNMVSYERFGTSRRATFYGLPDACQTVFFPGCALAGTRPDKTVEVFTHLLHSIPSLGIVLDCCMKISHDLGDEARFTMMFEEMKDFLLKQGVRNVIVACPNCYRVFEERGGVLSVESLYEILVKYPLGNSPPVNGVVTIHDPCAVRLSTETHDAVRSLVRRTGLTVQEMDHHGERTLCCGEGGMVSPVSPDLARNWAVKRKGEAGGLHTVTYCAGCVNQLGPVTPTSHVLDLLLEPSAALAGKARVSRGPITYWNRLRLKNRFRKLVVSSIVRERTFTGEKAGRKSAGGRLVLLAAVVAAILVVRFTGVTQYIEEERLRHLIENWGSLAPLIYILVYTLAPSLLFPGLPITIAGGVLFGPLWGVVYTIIGSTLGACLAFMVARYVARGWVENKLVSPRWRRLDEGVEKHGWKVVAITRLIPLFPFNLLNYAFGLTKIKFWQYGVVTFICMLPACIAFIVFSSSLLDLIRGRVSSTFIAGVILIVVVSLFPMIYRRYSGKGTGGDPI